MFVNYMFVDSAIFMIIRYWVYLFIRNIFNWSFWREENLIYVVKRLINEIKWSD